MSANCPIGARRDEAHTGRLSFARERRKVRVDRNRGAVRAAYLLTSILSPQAREAGTNDLPNIEC